MQNNINTYFAIKIHKSKIFIYFWIDFNTVNAKNHFFIRFNLIKRVGMQDAKYRLNYPFYSPKRTTNLINGRNTQYLYLNQIGNRRQIM